MALAQVKTEAAEMDVTPVFDLLEKNGPAGREARRLPTESVDALKQTGFIRALLPRSHGGLEVTPQEFFSAQMAVAEQDMSTAWAGGIIAVHAYQLALMDQKARDTVYADGPDVCISSSYNPVGAKCEAVEGGVMLSGRWGWSSGTDHCTWCLLGGVIPGEGYRTFLVPKSDYVVEDTWYSMGLQGTGSNDVVIEAPVFVPDHMTHKQMDGFNCVNDQENPMYNIPWAQFFIRVVSTPAIGAAKRAIKLFSDSRSGASTDPTKDAADPDVLRRVSEATQLVEEAEALLFRNFDRMMEAVKAGREIPMIDRVRYRYQASLVIENMMAAVDLLFNVAGGRSVFVGAEIQNIWHDIHIARAHVANNPVGFARNLGNMMLGGENKDVFV